MNTEGKGLTVGYIRVSTDGQEDGNGLEVQRQHIIAYAALKGFEVQEWFQDVESGAKEDRPELARMRKLVNTGEVSRVLVYKLDRLARDTRIALNLEHEFKIAGADFMSVSETTAAGPEGDLMRTIMFAFAAFERAQIATRTKAGRREAVRKNGTFAGGAGVLGYRPVGRRGESGKGALQIVESEAEAVRMIFNLKAKGQTLQTIAQALNIAGYTTARGSAFSHVQVLRVLNRAEFYRGQGVLTASVEAQAVAHQPILAA